MSSKFKRNRACANYGYWKDTGDVKEIVTSKADILALKKCLEFWKWNDRGENKTGHHAAANRTGWRILEYRILDLTGVKVNFKHLYLLS